MSAVKKPVELARIISYRPEKSIEATIRNDGFCANPEDI